MGKAYSRLNRVQGIQNGESPMMIKIDQYVVKINRTVCMRLCGCVCMYDSCVNVRTCVRHVQAEQ